ncbi:ATP-binding protein [Chitinophaga horti]|uniref:ATP-binding protein n=1 Tax=Chitinophaga horti TaxID=2920382 RepID=A0ABY6J817_9BACT|nr:ATP-binding protein [Chitinophaga horti]UYQ95838.1 ATP-binding protein [Chitinophaga horti]
MNVTNLTIRDQEKISLDDIQFSRENREILDQVLREHRHVAELKKYNLPVDNKILLHGHSGCGKTTTAKAIATALGKNIVIVNLSTLVSSRLGETAQNMQLVFEKAMREKSVLFLDEFDHIGKMRVTDDKDSGEIRRLVNSLIQQIDYLPADTLLIAATNYPELIDGALLRRFQLKLKYEMPGVTELDAYYDKRLAVFPAHLTNIERQYGISYAEARDYVNTAMKARIIEELENGEM